MLLFFFFFQAEDGIRDVAVTGVQTCALPIYLFIVTPILNVSRQFWRLPDAASLLVGHAPAPGRAFECGVLLQSVKLALRTGFLVRRAFLARLSKSFAGSNANAKPSANASRFQS